MKTPQQTAEYLTSQKDKTAALALKQREKYLGGLEKELSDILDGAIKRGEVTEKGGEITYPNFNFLPDTGKTDIRELFRQAGWNCQYRPTHKDCYSATCESDYTPVIHIFCLSLLNNDSSQESPLERIFTKKKIRPLSPKEKRRLDERIAKRVAPFKTKPQWGHPDYWTPI